MPNILRKHPLVLVIFFLPTTALMGVFVLYPLFNGVRLSFTDATLLRPDHQWVGLSNFIFALTDPIFWEVLYNSVVIIGASIVASLVIGFSIALLLNTGLRGVRYFRTGVFQVWVVPWIVIAILWGWIFNSDFGVVNYLLEDVGVISEPLAWLAEPGLAQLVIVVGFTWRMIPFMMVVSLAALQAIPRDFLDAAAVDGAGAWQRLRYIILPLVRNILLIVSLLQTVRLFQEITLPFVLTQGGPINATTTLSLYTFKIAFQRWDFGLASSVGTMWMLLLVVFSAFYVRLLVSNR